MNLNLSEFTQFNRDTKLLLVVATLSSISFYGISNLLKTLYVLRLGFGPEYLGLFVSVGALTYMSMGIPSGALGGRFGPKRIMLIGGAIASAGMVLVSLTKLFPSDTQSVWLITTQIVLIAGWSIFNVNLVPALKGTTTTENVNRVYAVSGVLRSLGTFLGAIIGGLLPGLFARLIGQMVDDPTPYRLGQWVAAGLMLTVVGPLTLIRQSQQTIPEAHANAFGRFSV